jgi:hypothetical protein
MNREEFFELINSMDENNEGYGESWYEEGPIPQF